MKLFNFKSLTMQIIGAFLVIMVLTTGFIVFNYAQNSKMEENSKELIEKQLHMVMANQEVAASITVRAAASTNYIVTGEESYLAIFQAYTKIADEKNKLLMKLDPKSTEERQQVIDQAVAWREAVQQDVFKMQQKGEKEVALKNLKVLNDEATVIRKQYEALAKENADEITKLGEEVIATTNYSKVTGLFIGVIIIILSITIAILSARSISKPIQLVSERMKKISQGDLSNKNIQTTRQDEIGTLIGSVNVMSEQMQSILQSIHGVSETVASNSEELSQSAIEVKQGSNQIAQTMQELSNGMDMQTNRTNELANVVGEFKQDATKVMAASDVLTNNSSTVYSLTQTGKTFMDKSSQQMVIIDKIMQQSVTKVEGLQHQSQEITQLVKVIKEIANQTNLLALNAAIEAARAGEHGKGFSVVADEVRKLAEQVQHSIGDISSIVERIQQETSNVTLSLQDGYSEVQRGTEQIKETNDTFDEIAQSVDTMQSNISQIAKTLTDFDTNTEVINATIQEVAALSEEVSAAIYETTSTVEETAAIIEEMANSNVHLADSAERLNDEVNHFKL